MSRLDTLNLPQHTLKSLTETKTLKVATAFSGGFGSIEMALKYDDEPHEVVFACEWMDAQRKSYLINHGEPASNFYKDIRDLDGTKYKGQIDLYHLSPPCQSYSMAGSRGGADDERGGLMFEAIKSIDEVQPKMFTIENVRGLLSSNGGEDWNNILRDIKSLKNYSISYGVMNAKDQGTPQNRERVFIVGFRGKASMMPFPKIIKLDKCLADLLEDNVDDKYYLSEKMLAGFISHKDRHDGRGNGFGFKTTDVNGVCGSISTKCGNRQTDPYISELNQVGNIDQKGHNSLWGRVYDPEGIAPTQNAKGGGAGAKTGLFRIKTNNSKGYEEVHEGDSISFKYPTSKTRRGRVGKQLAQTLDTSCEQAVALERIRRLTPRECARVQGDFDDKFKFGEASDTKLYEFIGNAMDISTTRNLLKAMFSHKVEFTEPQEPSFTIKEAPKDTLF